MTKPMAWFALSTLCGIAFDVEYLRSPEPNWYQSADMVGQFIAGGYCTYRWLRALYDSHVAGDVVERRA